MKEVNANLLDDGRRIQKISSVIVDESTGEEKAVFENWEEPDFSKKLTKRVTSYKKPLIYKREVEVFDVNGDLVEKKVEALEDETKLNEVKAQSFQITTNQNLGVTTPVENQFVTKAELNESLMKLARVLNNTQQEAPVTLSAQSILENKYAAPVLSAQEVTGQDSKKEYVVWTVLATLIGVFAYVVFLM